ncbi:MAG: septum formation initiator family protein [Candidatus Babeliales bacterium]|jgi:cell division protein FtsB
MDHHALIRTAMLISCTFVVGAYIIFGPRGTVEYLKKRQHVAQTQQKIATLENSITNLSQTLITYQHHPFALEKSARYDYCMGYTNEIVYIVPSETSH